MARKAGLWCSCARMYFFQRKARDASEIGRRLGGRAQARAWSKAKATQQAGIGSRSRLNRGSDREMVTGGLVAGIVKTN